MNFIVIGRLCRSILSSNKAIKSATKMSLDTKVLKVDPNSVFFPKNGLLPVINDRETEANLKTAAQVLRDSSNVVAFPTETVYGLAGSALNDESVRNIYRAKNRPADNPLIVHVSSIEQMKRKLLPEDYEIPEVYGELLEKFWPGPLTILLPIHEDSPISKLVTANQSTFAVRLPLHPIARALIALSDTPLAAPSANASTRPSPTLASHVYHDLNGKIPYIVDGGACSVGVESTVVDGLSSPPMLLRPGGVSLEQIVQHGGEAWRNVKVGKKTADKNESVKTPGMKYKHYSPSAPVVVFLNCGDGVLAVRQYISTHEIENAKIALLTTRHFAHKDAISPLITTETPLGTTGGDISRNLFGALREADATGAGLILVEGIDESDEGLAVMNRLTKAAQSVIEG